MRADRGGGTPGVRSETRERGDEGARVDREEIERARRPTGVDNGRARQRRRARPIREISQNRTSVRRREQKPPFNRSSGPPKGAFEPPSARPRALPLAHSPVLLEETRSRQDRAPSAMARARRSPPRHLRPSQNRLVGRASNGKVRRSKNPPGFRPRVRRGHGRRLPPQVSSGAQSQCAHDWLTVCPYGNHKLETWASKPARAERMTIVASSDERVRDDGPARVSRASRAPRPRAAAFSRAARRPETKRRCPPWPAPP